jgi:hypothetical protein
MEDPVNPELTDPMNWKTRLSADGTSLAVIKK